MPRDKSRPPAGAAGRGAGEPIPAAPPAAVLEPFLRLVANVIIFNQQVADRLGLGMTDMQFMTYLQQEGAITPGRLSELSGLRSGTVSGVLDRLEAAGYIRRERDPGDRRRVLVHLDGARVGREAGPMYAGQAAHLAAVFDAFDRDQQATVVRFLETLVPPGPAPGVPEGSDVGR